MGEGKQLIDAEALVRWAAVQELPKKRPGAVGFVAPPLHLLEDGELVGRWTWPASYPSISPMFMGRVSGGSASVGGPSGEPDEDALELERALYEIARDPPAVEGEAGLVSWGIGDGVASAEEALARARRNIAGLVLGHGGLGSRPDWQHEPFTVRAIMAEGGKAIVWRIGAVTMPTLGGEVVEVEGEIRCKARRKDDYPNGAYCRIVYEPDPARVIADRADYLVWRIALGALARALKRRLRRFDMGEPAAPLAPWIGA